MKPEDLQALLEANDVEGCIAFFASATEAERRALAKTAVARLKAVPSETPDGFDTTLDMPAQVILRQVRSMAISGRLGLRAVRIAVLATATLGELKKLGERGLPPILDDAMAVLSARRPPWLREWAEMILSWGLRGHAGST